MSLNSGDRVIVIDLDESWDLFCHLSGKTGTLRVPDVTCEGVYVDLDEGGITYVLSRLLRRIHPLEDLARCLA